MATERRVSRAGEGRANGSVNRRSSSAGSLSSLLLATAPPTILSMNELSAPRREPTSSKRSLTLVVLSSPGLPLPAPPPRPLPPPCTPSSSYVTVAETMRMMRRKISHSSSWVRPLCFRFSNPNSCEFSREHILVMFICERRGETGSGMRCTINSLSRKSRRPYEIPCAPICPYHTGRPLRRVPVPPIPGGFDVHGFRSLPRLRGMAQQGFLRQHEGPHQLQDVPRLLLRVPRHMRDPIGPPAVRRQVEREGVRVETDGRVSFDIGIAISVGTTAVAASCDWVGGHAGTFRRCGNGRLFDRWVVCRSPRAVWSEDLCGGLPLTYPPVPPPREKRKPETHKQKDLSSFEKKIIKRSGRRDDRLILCRRL